MTAALPKVPAILAACLGAAVLLGGGGWLAWKVFVPDLSEEVVEDRSQADSVDIAARSAVETRFPDAQAMTFSKTFTHRYGEGDAVCGFVDVEEEQDSFNGPERFVFADGELVIEEADGSEAVEARWRDVCEG